jgi:hypothetical protein
MSLSTLNAQAVNLLQDGCPDEAVSLLLEALERLSPTTDISIQNNDDILEAVTTSADQCSQISFFKEASSRAASEPTPCRRYHEAANRAAEAHLRQTRSLDDDNLNYNLQIVNSDVSDISQISRGMGENDQLTYGDPDITITIIINQSQSGKENTGSRDHDPSISTRLESIPLPAYLGIQNNVGDENAAETEDSSTAQPIVSDNIFTFYQRAFLLTISSLIESDDAAHSSKQSAVLLYNIAVAHHNYAMYRRDPVAAHREFRTALVFYDLAFSTIQESLVDDTNENDEDFLLLLLAVLNNLGHIHAHHNNYLETQEMLTSLQEILAALRPPSGQPSAFMDHNNHNQEDFLFFYLNLVVYEEQEFAAAPAA